MAGTKLVIVESPAKAKTINKYLGADFEVLASFGHIRDLPPRDGSVRPDDDFAMDWELGERAERVVADIARAAKGAETIYLATDPDREGEAIAWHVREILLHKKLADRPIRRVTFNEITKSAVQQAIAQPRDLDQPLIDAYRARRALDYLVGFSLSPVLWRKLPGAKSAGRVQSVALRLICEREAEIERFNPREYWTIGARFMTAAGDSFPARLVTLAGEKLDKFALASRTAADAALARLHGQRWQVSELEKKQTRRHPYPPFTTASLQMEASRKLGLGATRTMRLAQQLYEGVEIGGETVGLITYMRTDGVQMAAEAISAARAVIGQQFGTSYLPDSPRQYQTKAKNAQEAHEAIRPTDFRRTPEQLARYLEADQAALYQLIWQRAVAAQMSSAVLDQLRCDIGNGAGDVFRATGSTVVFDGFLRVYAEEREDDRSEDTEEGAIRLPALQERQELRAEPPAAEQHFTQPPPRFSEASLVKELERLGIGRPSTYASIMQTLQDRTYVRLDKKRFVPEDRGRLVTTFLTNFFGRYFDYGFTASLEEQLDDISGSRADWRAVLRDFWQAFAAAIDGTKELKVSDVLNVLDETLGPHFFPIPTDGSDPRRCAACGTGRLGLKLGRFGAFIGCANYPECRFTRPLAVADGDASVGQEGPKTLGIDPTSQLPVTLRRGPYGTYVQLGEAAAPDDKPATPGKGKGKAKKDTAPKPRRASLPKGMDAAGVTIEIALQLLALPRDVGTDPNTQEMIQASIGRFGPYLKRGSRYVNLKGDDDVLTIGLNRAVALFAEAPARGGAQAGRVLGEHEGKPVSVHSGRYGPYVKSGKLLANLPKGTEPATATLEGAIAALQERAAKGGKGQTKGKARAAPKAASKPAAKKTPARRKKESAA